MTAHGNAIRDHSRKAEVNRVRVGKRYWLFTFSERWGPCLCDQWAEPVDNTPLADEGHPFWTPFEAWLRASAAATSQQPQTSPSNRKDGSSHKTASTPGRGVNKP